MHNGEAGGLAFTVVRFPESEKLVCHSVQTEGGQDGRGDTAVEVDCVRCCFHVVLTLLVLNGYFIVLITMPRTCAKLSLYPNC